MTIDAKRAAIRAKLRQRNPIEGWGWLVICLWRMRHGR
jgi:hypothetical protein